MANPCGPDIPQRVPGESGHLADHNKLHCFYDNHITTPGAHDAGVIANTPAGTLSSTNVQAALNELDAEKLAIINAIAAIITSIPSGNITSTNVQSALNELDSKKMAKGSVLFNVKDYGALGDGVTDDRAAIVAAQAALVALGEGILWFPKGTYMVSSPITGVSNVRWKGAGRGISIIKATAGFPNTTQVGLLQYGGVFGAGVNVTNIGASDLTFDMTAAPDTVVNRINAIFQDFGQVTHARFENLAFELLKNGQGILLNGLGASPSTESFDLVFRDIYGHNGAGTISLYLNARALGAATFSTSTYHSVLIDGCFNLVDLPGIIDDRVAIVGAQQDNTGGVPTVNTVIRSVSVNNVFVKMTAAVTSGLVNGVKLDTGRYCNITDMTISNTYFIGNGTASAGTPVIFLQAIGAGGTTTGLQDVEIDGVFGTLCGPIRTRFNRFAPQPFLSIRNVSLDNMINPDMGLEVYCPAGPQADEMLIIDGVSLHTTVGQGANSPVGIMLTSGTAGQGMSGKISISRVSTTGFKTGVSNNVNETGSTQASAWTNIVVRDSRLNNATFPVNLINAYEIRSCPGLSDLIANSATFTGEVTVLDLKPSGLTGAVAASRYVGATASGAPTSGTFAKGDFIVDQTGKIWICTTAGTPGTWLKTGLPFVNVADFATPQAAIDSSAFGAMIYFPNGTYTISAILSLKAGRMYLGANRESTVIKMANGANLDAVAASESWLSSSAVSSDNPVSVKDITFDANKANQTSGLGHGLVLMSFWNDVETVQARQCRGTGLLLTSRRQDGVETTGGVESHISRFDSRFCDSYGIRVQATTTNQETDGWLKDCIVQSCLEDGIRIDTATGWEIAGCHLYGTAKNGINLGRADSTRVHDNYIEPWGTSVTPGSYSAICLGDGVNTFIGSTNPSTVTNNTMYMGSFAGGTNLFGIRTVTASGAVSHIVVANNAMLGTGFHTGINIGNQSGTATTIITLVGNQIFGFVTKYVLTSTGTLTLSGGDVFKTGLATNATEGFTRLPSTAGAPTGVPADLTQGIPTVIDTTNNKLYSYFNSVWNTTPSAPDIQVFNTAGGTWTKPAGATSVAFILFGSGGGGASGRRGAALSVRVGGGGGSGGGRYLLGPVPAANVPSSLTVSVQAGGPGGAAVTVNDTNGNNGTTQGGNTSVVGTNFALNAGFAAGGSGGTASAGAGGSALANYYGNSSGGGASGTGGAGGVGGNSSGGASGGGSGGGITSADAVSNGGNGGNQTAFGAAGQIAAAGVAPGGAGANGTVITNPPSAATGGNGGGGGASSITGAAGNGGTGGFPGGGGGGGGASLNGNNSGAGGAGGDGVAIIITYF